MHKMSKRVKNKTSKIAKINVIGGIFGTGGYQVHTRNLANALNKQTDVKLVCELPPGWEQNVSDKELEMIKREDADTNLIIAMPQNWRQYADKKVNIGFLVWEGDKIPKSWIEECLNPMINYIFVPSQHTKDAIINTFSDWDGANAKTVNKIKVMPHGVSDMFKPEDIKKDSFTFLCNKGFKNLEDRGGIQYLLKAYNEEFTDENVKLILKINPAYGIPDINKLLKEIGYTQNSPKLLINTENIPVKDMKELYNKCDVFVSPTRAEAFNLPCLEALACGKPVISTNFGGQTDYLNKTNSFLIGGKLKEVEHDIIYEGIRWLTPNIDELRKVMRYTYENPIKLKTMAPQCLKTAKTYTWDATATKIKDLLKL